MGKLSAASALTTPAIDDYFWVYDASDPTNLKKISHADLCVSGSFTPALEGSSTAGTQTYDAQVGKYSRIGNIVHFNIYLDLATKDGATSGDLHITNLPYAADGLVAVNVANTTGWSITAGMTIQGFFNGGTHIVLLETDGATAPKLTDADFSGDEVIIISGTYTVA